MADAADTTCDQHKDRFDCPDALISYYAKFDEYGIIVHDGGTSVIGITHCPWCGMKFPESRRDQWFDELKKLGFNDPTEDPIPEIYNQPRWWKLTEQESAPNH